MLVFVQQLVHAMIDAGMKITVLAPQSIIHSLVHREKLLPIHSKAVTESGIEYDVYRPYILSFGNNNKLKTITRWFNKRVVKSKLQKIKSDVLYAHFWSNALLIEEYASTNQIPLFVACGEGDDALEMMVVSMSKEQIKKLSSIVTGVISVSSENKRKCVEYGLSAESDVEVFPNCVDTSLFCKKNVSDFKQSLGVKDGDFVVCFIGGFIPRKGPDRIAKAIEKLNDNQVKVIFIGKEFAGYTYEFDCSGIIVKKAVSHNELPKYLNCADVFVMPTLKEGCCNAIVEALACGLPVISSDMPFNYDILNEQNSIMVNPMDIEEIASAIKQLKDDVVLRKRMSEYSHSRHSEYSIINRSLRILKFMNNKVNKNSKP